MKTSGSQFRKWLFGSEIKVIGTFEKRASGPRGFLSREEERREKSLVTLNLNLTLMQAPAVKRIKLIITKGPNGNLAITRRLGKARDVSGCRLGKVT